MSEMIKNSLEKYMLKNGVPAADASLAAQRCSKAMTSSAKKGALAGLTIGLATTNPGALVMAVAGAGGGAALSMMGSPACAKVREAAFQIASDQRAGRPL